MRGSVYQVPLISGTARVFREYQRAPTTSQEVSDLVSRVAAQMELSIAEIVQNQMGTLDLELQDLTENNPLDLDLNPTAIEVSMEAVVDPEENYPANYLQQIKGHGLRTTIVASAQHYITEHHDLMRLVRSAYSCSVGVKNFQVSLFLGPRVFKEYSSHLFS